MLQEVNDTNFSQLVLQSEKPVLVDFWAQWCAPCLMLHKTMDELSDAYQEQASIVKLNVDEHPNLASQFHIRNIPSLLFFKDGKVVDKIVGAVSKHAIEEKLKRFSA